MMSSFKLLLLFACLTLIGQVHAQTAIQPQYQICMDVAHGEKFWHDPASMTGMDPAFIDRVKYMTGELIKTATSVHAGLSYLKGEIKPTDLAKCNVLFIHIPSAQYTASEVNAISQYIRKGGSLFLVMDSDYWSTLEQTNVMI